MPNQDRLVADCASCFGLCCVVLPFLASKDFAADKAAGEPCVNLEPDFRCGVHDRLREEGYRGCTVYDCFGAGQQVAQVTFGGRDWRQDQATASSMFDVFAIMRQLHELLWYLREALSLPAAQSIHAEIQQMFEHTERLTLVGPPTLLELDVAAHRAAANALLQQASELTRSLVRSDVRNHRAADLIGADLSGSDLRAANLRGALLIAADLTGADLRSADLIGADVRDADLSGADLTDSLFVTQAQLNAAKGDGETLTPSTLTRPLHWLSPSR